MTKDEAMKMALETLECLKRDFDADQFEWGIADEAITAIKEALAHPEQYPQIAINPEIVGYVAPQSTWVGLTQTQVKLLWEGVQEEAIKSGDSLNWVFYTHINEALKEKNT